MMKAPFHILILDDQETFLLYKSIVESIQYNEIEFENTKDPLVFEEIKQLRQLTRKVFLLMNRGSTTNVAN